MPRQQLSSLLLRSIRRFASASARSERAVLFAQGSLAMTPRGVFGRPSSLIAGTCRSFHPRFYWDDPHATTTSTVATAAVARELLGLQERRTEDITARELRTAYYRAAKECHPDSSASKKKRRVKDEDASESFRLVTEAYELLQQQQSKKGYDEFMDDDDNLLFEQQHSEADYRSACLEWLGQPAEVVEESKRCPAFRQWLSGRTDAAYYWNNFFMLHGGLAPRLLPRQLGMNRASAAAAATPTLEQRPRRKRRR